MADEEIPSSRVKACIECRQHKIRCDKFKDPSQPCSKCRWKNLPCSMTGSVRRPKRRTKAQLENELADLKEGRGPGTASSGVDDGDPSSPALQARPADPGDVDTKLTQSFDGVNVDDEDIENCWLLYFRHYHPHLPVVEDGLLPIPSSDSRLLFWTIVMTGARRYETDPNIFPALAPKVFALAEKEIFAREGWPFLRTITALLILCTWPAQFPTIDSDISQVLAGSALGLALRVGLHVAGNGQEFVRYKVTTDNTDLVERRARIWSGLLVVYQHLSFVHGTPPITKEGVGYNNHSREVFSKLPISLKFQDQLSNIQSEALNVLHLTRRDTMPDQQANALDPLISSYLGLLDQLPSTGDTDVFFLRSAALQICSYYLLCPRPSMDVFWLERLFEYACGTIEAADALDRVNDFSRYAPLWVSYYLQNAAQFVVRLGNCKYRESLSTGAPRSKRAILNAIRIFRKMSLDGSDTHMRSAAVTSQLWSTSKFFKDKNGEIDGLQVRCADRYAMSVAHDCWWRWRAEFASLDDPFAGVDPINPVGTDHLRKGSLGVPAPGIPNLGLQPNLQAAAGYLGLDDLGDVDFGAPEYQNLMQFDWSQIGLPLEIDPNATSLPASFW